MSKQLPDPAYIGVVLEQGLGAALAASIVSALTMGLAEKVIAGLFGQHELIIVQGPWLEGQADGAERLTLCFAHLPTLDRRTLDRPHYDRDYGISAETKQLVETTRERAFMKPFCPGWVESDEAYVVCTIEPAV